MIQLHVYEEIVNFKEEVTPFLEKNEQENNLILGVLQMVHQPIFMGIAETRRNCSCISSNRRRNKLLFATSEISGVAIKELAKELTKIYPDIPGLIGDKKVVQHQQKRLRC